MLRFWCLLEVDALGASKRFNGIDCQALREEKALAVAKMLPISKRLEDFGLLPFIVVLVFDFLLLRSSRIFHIFVLVKVTAPTFFLRGHCRSPEVWIRIVELGEFLDHRFVGRILKLPPQYRYLRMISRFWVICWH